MSATVYVLGVSGLFHDSAACLLRDGQIVAAAQEERFTRRRHDAALPTRAIAWCLEDAGIDAGRVDHVVFYDKPVRKFGRLLESYLLAAPRSFGAFVEALPSWLKNKLWVAQELERALGVEREVLFTEHHMAHAASAFYPSPFERAAVLTLDGVGEYATASAGVGEGASLTLQREIRFPHSLGLLYSAFTAYLGFRVNSGEYKVMGLAPYGEPRHRETILRELIDVREDGSFRLDLRYFDFVSGRSMTSERFHTLFGGAPRPLDSPPTQREMDLAASVQAVTEEVVLRMCRDLHRRTGLTDLCMAGGVALNCTINGRILKADTGFERLWVQPAAGDAGGAIGCALATWHQHLGRPRSADGLRDAMRGARLGSRVTEAEVAALRAGGAVATKLSEEELVRAVAERIAGGAIVGWCEGRMEFGPRALGGRSILADPRDADMKRRLNEELKLREGFRPFAPSVPREDARAYFDLPGDSPYMLVTAPVRKGAGLPAVTHVDGSARVQTVDAQEHPRFHRLLRAVGERTGVPVLVNTSFNVRGEPIIRTAAEAYRCFMRTGMDCLVLEDWLFHRGEQPPWVERDDWRASLLD